MLFSESLPQFVVAEEERNLEEDAEEDGNDDGANNDKQDGYYGYGYYDANGVWTTPYKTMFQIQYFNIVLWTSVVLFLVTAFSIFLVTDMPLEVRKRFCCCCFPAYSNLRFFGRRIRCCSESQPKWLGMISSNRQLRRLS